MARILSVEDDPDIQHLLGLALHREGYEVHYAFTGQEGYEKLLLLNPDLLIVDMMLPVLNGVELMRLARSHKPSRDTPIIVVTSFAEDPRFVENAVRTLGVVQYIRKPVRLEELVRLVRRTLEDRPDRAPPELRLRKGAVRIDPGYRSVWIRDRLLAVLPRRRFEILSELLRSAGPVPACELARRLWGADASDNNVEKTIQRLREDFGPVEAGRIRTTPRGYELVG